ncbi:U-box domain-containing protein 14 [Stylosanthes scabra]|uniref:RING-type E3 ubiquitin transferase n=1 Tax=Stylosanthes scabra TaxID=79078 RepID=A0ABU6RFH6_9FABA|nr:U-box domain-containing protein 14 [Stylosanthes scabra]
MGGGGGEKNSKAMMVVASLAESIKEISGLPECNNVCKRMYGNLVRRVKLLSPLFEELKDSDDESLLTDEQVAAFECLKVALDSAKTLLNYVNQGSKLYQALQRNDTRDKFQQITEKIEEALCGISYNKLEISEEVQEQIELVHAQFKRAKTPTEFADLQLDLDMEVAQKEKDPDPPALKRLSEKLHLRTINDLKKESAELHELVITSGGEPGDYFETITSLLRKMKDCVLTENPEVDSNEGEKMPIKHRSPVIPDDFRCPISLELMKDPVIVSTGQTYERSCIQKWLDAGHKTCPKTQQTLLHTALTPNYVLKSLIALWCESNGVELPKKQGSCRAKKSGSNHSDCDRTAINALLDKLANGDMEQQRAAAGELRLLAKRNADNRVCIAEAGAIPLLVELLSSSDPRTQEHAVTALLNLSINESNKGTIVNAGAIPDIVDVLKSGSMEARENAAATLFSLSVLDENKVAIGAAGAIPVLIKLLCEGTPRGKKDAATAIFNLSIYQGNKARAIKAGIIAPLMRFLKDAGGGMVDEALAIMAILASHHEGRIAIGQAEPIPILVEVIRTGSPRNRENAAAVLWSLCTGDLMQLKLAKELGAEEALHELSENGTDRAKRKAGSILELLQRMEGDQNVQSS